jgi:uncharacterized membrane-anchored protein YhcB (DUF1043 family)
LRTKIDGQFAKIDGHFAKIDGQFDNIDNQFKAMMESLSTARKLLLDTPQKKASHSPEQDYSN